MNVVPAPQLRVLAALQRLSVRLRACRAWHGHLVAVARRWWPVFAWSLFLVAWIYSGRIWILVRSLERRRARLRRGDMHRAGRRASFRKEGR